MGHTARTRASSSIATWGEMQHIPASAGVRIPVVAGVDAISCFLVILSDVGMYLSRKDIVKVTEGTTWDSRVFLF